MPTRERPIKVDITPHCKNDLNRAKKLCFATEDDLVTLVDCHPGRDYGFSTDLSLAELASHQADPSRLPGIFHTFARNFGMAPEALLELIFEHRPRRAAS